LLSGLTSSVKKEVKDMSNVDTSETVKLRNAILSALNRFLERNKTYIAELAYSSKCYLLSEYCGQKSKKLWFPVDNL